jgi:hypothetical protein
MTLLVTQNCVVPKDSMIANKKPTSVGKEAVMA